MRSFVSAVSFCFESPQQVTPARDQGMCGELFKATQCMSEYWFVNKISIPIVGSCWAYAAAAAVESAYLIQQVKRAEVYLHFMSESANLRLWWAIPTPVHPQPPGQQQNNATLKLSASQIRDCVNPLDGPDPLSYLPFKSDGCYGGSPQEVCHWQDWNFHSAQQQRVW